LNMKLFVKYLIITFILSVTTQKEIQAQGAAVSFQVFYDDLSPHGSWIDYPNYGYVWIPNIATEFIPYSTAGHWAMTSYGWTWVSNYSWGWAPFHYGRWWYDNFYGWFWVPDNVWGPAWVIWRSSPGYYGWAPLGPNISLTFAMSGGYNPPIDYWCYAPSQYMGRQDISTYYGPRKNTSDFINTSSVVNNTYVDSKTQATYIAGPKGKEVEKAAGRPVKMVTLKEHSKPVQVFENNTLKLYRPVISKEGAEQSKPAKITDKKDIRSIPERTETEPAKKVSETDPKGQATPKADNPGVNPDPKGKSNHRSAPVKEMQQQQPTPEKRVDDWPEPAQQQQQPVRPGVEKPLPPPAPVEHQPVPVGQDMGRPVMPPPVPKPLPVPPRMENQAPPAPMPPQPRQEVPARPN
jgi:hypothetical protein